MTNYNTPGHPAAFAGISTTQRYAPSKKSAKDTEKELARYHAFTKHRQKNRPKAFNPFIAHQPRDQIQMDLIIIDKLAHYNRGVKYLLVAIDCFSRKAVVVGIKKKTKEKTLEAIQLVFEELLPPKPKTVIFDKGTEFVNRLVTTYLDEHNIKHFNPSGRHKAAIAERFNRTIQGMIYRYMTQNNTKNYIAVLDQLVESYNSRYHRTIRMSPNQAEKPENSAKVREVLGIRLHKAMEKPAYELGESVRILRSRIEPRHSFRRGYLPLYSDEIFTISRIKANLPITMYKVVNNNLVERPESFYASELQRVSI